MASGDEGHAYPIQVDRRSLVREEADHHGQEDLRAVIDVDGEYHQFVPNG